MPGGRQVDAGVPVRAEARDVATETGGVGAGVPHGDGAVATDRGAWIGRIGRAGLLGFVLLAPAVFYLFFRIGLMNELQYRASFFIQLGKSLQTLVISLTGVAVIYSLTGLGLWLYSHLLARQLRKGAQLASPGGRSLG